MDKTEVIALGIVAVAAVVFIRGFFKKSKKNCCDSACGLKSKTSRTAGEADQSESRPQQGKI